MEVEKRKLSKFEEELKVERRLISDEKEKLQKFTDDVCTRSKEVDAMCKVSDTDMRLKPALQTLKQVLTTFLTKVTSLKVLEMGCFVISVLLCAL